MGFVFYSHNLLYYIHYFLLSTLSSLVQCLLLFFLVFSRTSNNLLISGGDKGQLYLIYDITGNTFKVGLLCKFLLLVHQAEIGPFIP